MASKGPSIKFKVDSIANLGVSLAHETSNSDGVVPLNLVSGLALDYKKSSKIGSGPSAATWNNLILDKDEGSDMVYDFPINPAGKSSKSDECENTLKKLDDSSEMMVVRQVCFDEFTQNYKVNEIVYTKEGNKSISTSTSLKQAEDISFQANPSDLRRVSLKKVARQRGALTSRDNGINSAVGEKRDLPSFAEEEKADLRGEPKRCKIGCIIKEVADFFRRALLSNPATNYELFILELQWAWEPTCNSSFERVN